VAAADDDGAVDDDDEESAVDDDDDDDDWRSLVMQSCVPTVAGPVKVMDAVEASAEPLSVAPELKLMDA